MNESSISLVRSPNLTSSFSEETNEIVVLFSHRQSCVISNFLFSFLLLIIFSSLASSSIIIIQSPSAPDFITALHNCCCCANNNTTGTLLRLLETCSQFVLLFILSIDCITSFFYLPNSWNKSQGYSGGAVHYIKTSKENSLCLKGKMSASNYTSKDESNINVDRNNARTSSSSSSSQFVNESSQSLVSMRNLNSPTNFATYTNNNKNSSTSIGNNNDKNAMIAKNRASSSSPRKIFANKYDVSSTMSRLSGSMVGVGTTTQMTTTKSSRSSSWGDRSSNVNNNSIRDLGSDVSYESEGTSMHLLTPRTRRRNHGLDDYYTNDEEYHNLLLMTETQQQQQSFNDINGNVSSGNVGVNKHENNNEDDDDDNNIYDGKIYKLNQKKKKEIAVVNYDTFQSNNNQFDTINDYNGINTNDNNNNSSIKKKKMRETNSIHKKKKSKRNRISSSKQKIMNAFRQIPAVALIGMFHLMIGIPFGVSYFPIGWKEASQFHDTSSSGSSSPSGLGEESIIDGPFPIQGKNALGIRMFLFSTIMGQVIFTFKSGFKNPIGLNMVENVPFCQALATITIGHCGYGIEALSTLFVMFGLSSFIVGVVFYVLGRFELGRIIYFFPSHVLVGLIAGIGIFICRTGVEVTMNAVFRLESVFEHCNLLLVVLGFEIMLRLLEQLNVKYGTNGKPVFSLLSPIYFCSITPVFYGILWLIGVSVSEAEQNGYFFPSLVGDCGDGGDGGNTGCTAGGDGSSPSSTEAFSSFLRATVFNKDVFDIWRVIDFTNVSWVAIRDSIPTLIALTVFSLIHVPINIPAFAISTNSDYDMNKELIAHGYSNCLSGIFGGLQNYMAYTQSILYDRSGGYGKPSGIAVAIVTSTLFFFGPSIASAIPRCMAGTLLVHVGIDLFLEGVYDTINKFERLEYAGIWLIALVMTFSGMDAAMIAGKANLF